MSKKAKTTQATDFSEYLKKQLKNKDVRRYYQAYGKQLEIAYQVLRLRKEAGFSQQELARKIGTTQSNVARIESGEQNFTIETLERIARTFNKELEVAIK